MIFEAKPTTTFVGQCLECPRPMRVTRVDMDLDKVHVTCPGCEREVRLSRLYAAKEDTSCHADCMGAYGPNCSCSCGGKNHGSSWAFEEITISADALAAYQERKRREAAEREKREAKKAAASKAKWERWADENGIREIQRLYDKRSLEDPSYRPSNFLMDMMLELRWFRILTNRQVEVVKRIANDELVGWEPRTSSDPEPVELQAPTVPVGDAVDLEGNVVTVISRPGYRYNSTELRMLLEGDSGWKVWMTVPKALRGGPLPGKRVSVTATVTEGREPGVGNAKRPRFAAII